jgi:Uma2 family endonuclease
MALTQPILVTADDYRRMPETGPRYQLIEGDLIMSPAPNRYHQDISRNLGFLLLKYLEKHPIGRLYHAPFDVYLGPHNVFQPDIVFVAKERSSIFTKAGAEGAPNLVIEILSPRTAYLDKDPKRKLTLARASKNCGFWTRRPNRSRFIGCRKMRQNQWLYTPANRPSPRSVFPA